jgi:hypothetical protein
MLVATFLAIFSWWQSVLSLPAETQGKSLMLVATSLAIFSWWQSVLSLPSETQGKQELNSVGCHTTGNILMVAISFISFC